jgi:type II secretory ATPase GspE/PulE/Tfp pilus assembly ATPase PilB-like protein
MIARELESLPADFKKDANLPKESEIMIFEPGECKKCKTGYMGRIALFEILEMTKELGEIVLKEPDEIKIKAEAKRQGMITMKQDGILKALAGVTSIEEVLRVAENNN